MFSNPHESKFCKTSRWRWIIILDSYTKEQIQCYPLDENARLLLKMKRQKRRSLGKMTGRKGIPRNKNIALKKFKKMFPNDSIKYNPKEKSLSKAENSRTKTISLEQDNNEENKLMMPIPIINSSIFNSSKLISSPVNESTDSNNDKNDPQMYQYLSSLDWLLNECNSNNIVC